MKAVFLDTHAVLWLFGGLENKFPDSIKELIEVNNVYISPMVVLELKYLNEIKRFNSNAKEIINYLKEKIDLQIDDLSFEVVVQRAMNITWTRDVFDRLIVSQALIRENKLITKDQHILNNFSLATWNDE